MAMKIRAQPNLNFPGAKRNEELRRKFRSFLIWENKPFSETVSTYRKRKSDSHVKVDDRRIIYDRLDRRDDMLTSQEMLDDDTIKPLSNPSDPYDDINLFWSPRELLYATKALATYDVKELYKKNPYTVKNILHLIFLIVKYKPLLKDLLEVGEYFQRFPEDVKDEDMVCIALFDILCRGNGITLENEMNASLRTEYKSIGLKVVYMQVEKDKIHYFAQVHDRLTDIGASSVHNLLPTTTPIQINFEFPMIFDVWINKSKLDIFPEELLEGAGFKRASTRTSSEMTYNEIVELPYFFELGVSNYSEFVKTSHYCNHVFIPADRNHCLAMAQVVKLLYKGGITNGTVIQTHILSLGSTAYFAYLLNLAFPLTIKLKVFGADQMKASFESYFDLLNLKNVKVFSERFYIVNVRKKDIASTACVLINPETVFNPSLNLINETMKRGCDIVYLKSTYELFSENDTFNYSFVNQHTQDLKEIAKSYIQRALSIPKVKFVVYQSFDTKETADDNIALYVVNFARECSHTTIETVKENMSPTEMEDANYHYCKQLNLYFRQGNTQNNRISPALWGSKPPFITTIYHVDPVIYDSETEGERNEKNSTSDKPSSLKSYSVKSAPYPGEKQLRKFSPMAYSMTSESWREKIRNVVSGSGFSTYSDMKKKIISSKGNIKSSKDRKRGKYGSVKSESSNKSNLQMCDKKIFETFFREDYFVKKTRSLSSTISSVRRRSSMTLLQVRGSPPDFKKMVLSNDMFKNEQTPILSEKEDPVLKKILKNKRSKKKSGGDKKEVLFSDEVENIDFQQVSESNVSSQIQNTVSESSSDYKKNERLSKKKLNYMEDTPPQIKEKSDKELNRGSSTSKYFQETSQKKNVKRNKNPRTSKKMDEAVKEQTLLTAQHSPINVNKIIDSKAKVRKLPKKSYITNQSNILPKNYSKVAKEVPLISFGTRIQQKSTRGSTPTPNLKSKNRILLNKENTTVKKKADVKEVYTASSQQKPLKFHVNTKKQLNNMQKRFKTEIIESFQNQFFHSKKQSDVEEKSNCEHTRPSSSSVSWRTYARTARKLSDLNLLEMLKNKSLKNEKQRRTKSGSKRTKDIDSSVSTVSELDDITDDDVTNFSRRNDTVLWSYYKNEDFTKLLMEIEKNERNPYPASSILKREKSDNISLTTSILEMHQKELESSVSQSAPRLNKNKEKMISKRKTKSKNKTKSKKKLQNKKKSRNDSNTKIKKSLTKIIMEHNEGTQTKTSRKTEVYNIGTQADQLEIYMSLMKQENNQQGIEFINNLIHHSTVPSAQSVSQDQETADQLEIYMSLMKQENNQQGIEFINNPIHHSTMASQSAQSVSQDQETALEEYLNVSSQPESKPNQEQAVTVSKIISWFRKLESQAPIPPRFVSYVLKRRPAKDSSTISRTEQSSVQVEDSEDMIEEGVDDISELNQDYKIEDAQTILAQMKMYDTGERNLNKLINTDFTEFIDFDLILHKDLDEKDSREKQVPEAPEAREEIVALNKNLLKFKADELSYESFTDDDGYEEQEPFDMETEGKEMNNLLVKLIDNIFETDAKTRRITGETVSIHTEEVVKVSPSQSRHSLVDSEEQLQSRNMEEVWKNTPKEEWNEKNKELVYKTEEEKTEVTECECEPEAESEEDLKQPDLESDRAGTSVGEVFFSSTPTDGLSPLAKELYEIRDVIEFYLHSKVEPLDWRVMIDRRAED
ncbi:unnamed protein product [Nezara viridula]|uniref:Uncharacterized protein n=1 Tax=Nezara viridula TaxID=85310 RepID=A0A9P0ECB6_NEZVI|nr:unnamed protein product [Nezara viridula]